MSRMVKHLISASLLAIPASAFAATTPEQFRQRIENDAKRYGEIAASLGWKPE